MKNDKIKYVIPNLFTAASLISGLIAIEYVTIGYSGDQSGFVVASWLIILAMVFDGLDGKMARLFNAVSKFGTEIDSLSDFAVFGVVPAFLAYKSVLHQFGTLGKLVSIFYVLAGVFRLARFNTRVGNEKKKNFFEGLPIPAAASVISAFLIINYHTYGEIHKKSLFLVIVLLSAVLMVSQVEYVAINKGFKFTRKVLIFLSFFSLVSIIIAWFFSFKLLLFWIPVYLLYGIIRHIILTLGKHEETTKIDLPEE